MHRPSGWHWWNCGGHGLQFLSSDPPSSQSSSPSQRMKSAMHFRFAQENSDTIQSDIDSWERFVTFWLGTASWFDCAELHFNVHKVKSTKYDRTVFITEKMGTVVSTVCNFALISDAYCVLKPKLTHQSEWRQCAHDQRFICYQFHE